MSKRPAPKKQPVYEESSSDEDEQPEQPQKPQVKAAAPKFPKPKGAAPKDQDGKTMEWNGEAGQWESYDQHGEVTYFRLPKTSAAPEPTPSKKAAVAAAAAVPVSAEVVELQDDDAAEEDDFVVKLRKKQRKIMKAAKQEVAEIDQVIADHGEKEDLKSRLAALEAAEKKYGGSSSADAE